MMSSADPIGLGALTTQLATTAAKNVLNSKTMLDSVDKLRVSNPENLIDTDFEYGLQNTKLETLQMVNNIPTFYSRDADGSIELTDITVSLNSAQIVVTTAVPHGFYVGSPFFLAGLNEVTVEGYNIVLFVVSDTQFIFRANNRQTITGSIFDVYTSQMYPARVYQGTQFTSENITSMETDGEEQSTITVKTVTPHGFLPNTSLMLINSVGQKQIEFDGANSIDINNTVSITSEIDRNAATSLDGYNAVAVNPYDWQGRKAVFFTSSNVDTAENIITVPGHGFDTNDNVMYVAPVGDTPIGTLKSFTPFAVTKVTNDTIKLRSIYTDLNEGLQLHRFAGLRSSSPIEFINRDHDFEIIRTSTADNNFSLDTNYTSAMVGYFVPPVTGVYSFQISAGNECRLTVYIGTHAKTDSHTAVYSTSGRYATVSNATLTTGPLLTSPAPAAFQLTAGTWLPIRIQVYGRSTTAGVNSGSFAYSDPLETTFGSTAIRYNSTAKSRLVTISAINFTTNVLTTATHSFISTFPVKFRTTSVTIAPLVNNATYYVRTLTATTLTLHLTKLDATNNTNIIDLTGTFTGTNTLSSDHTFFVVPGRSYTTAVSPAVLSSSGTSLYGNHSLHKCYMVDATDRADYLTTTMNAANFVNAPLVENSALKLFAPYIPNPSNAIASTIYPNSNPFISRSFGVHAQTHMSSLDNISRTNYLSMFVKGPPTIGQKVTITSFASTNLTSTELVTANLTTTFTTGHAVLFETTSGSFTSLVNGAVYYVRRTADATVELYPSVAAALSGATTGRVAITGANTANTNFLTSLSTNLFVSTALAGVTNLIRSHFYNATMFVVPTISLDTRDTFYIPNHEFQSGNSVQYSVISGSSISGLTSGAFYNIQRISNNYIRLLTSANVEVDMKSIGTGIVRITYDAPNPTRDTFFIDNHGLFETSAVVYSNNGNTSIPGLVNESTYYIWNADNDKFCLSSSPSAFSAVDVTGLSEGIHFFTSTDRATDGIISVSTVTSDSMSIQFPFKIPEKDVIFNPLVHLDLSVNAMYFPIHRQRSGNRIIYYNNDNTSIDGLTTETSYYVIRIDTNFFKLALSYDDAINNISIPLTDLGTGINHRISFVSVIGEIISSQNVKLVQNSTTVHAQDEDLLSTLRIGDQVAFAILPSPVERTISAINTTSQQITTTVAHNLVTGNAVRYSSTAGTITSLVVGGIYYVNQLTTTTFTLHFKIQDAIDGQNPATLTGTVTANAHKLTSNYIGSVFEGNIKLINDKNNAVLTTNSPISSTTAIFLKTTNLYPRANGIVLHRPYDGGADLIPSNNPDSQVIRQTRKYFRYQSGKGIQMSSAVNFSGYTEIENLYREDDRGFIVTKRPHRLTTGIHITIEDAAVETTGNWNAELVIDTIVDERIFSFLITATPLPANLIAGGFPKYYVNNWTDASIRIGLFDDQNGMFFEYDGNTLYAVRRNSTTQLPGNATVNFNSPLIGGTNTRFTSQLDVGDRIVIKGVSYKVVLVPSDFIIFVQPPYRGISSTNVIISKTVDLKTPQHSWSDDTLDGNNASGHTIDIHKIQMAYIDYSWYGAGNIRFGFRARDGNITICHQYIHSNRMQESYMRSGNMAGRYEVSTSTFPTYVPALLHWGTSIIMDGRYDNDKAYWFTAAGKNLTYTGSDSITLLAMTCPFAATSTTTTHNLGYRSNQEVNGYEGVYWALNTATTYTTIKNIPSGTAISGIGIVAGTKTVGTPTLTAGGTRSYVYIDKQPTGVNITVQTITAGEVDVIPTFIPIVSIRLAPSVDNSRTGPIGSREIINRMQIFLRQVGILSTHDLEVVLRLNSVPYNPNWNSVASPSLSQLIVHEKGDTVSGGIYIYSFRASGGAAEDTTGRRASNSTSELLSDITDLGNCILGGDGTFPNGPDVLTIGASIIDTAGIAINSPFSVSARITWTEAQA